MQPVNKRYKPHKNIPVLALILFAIALVSGALFVFPPSTPTLPPALSPQKEAIVLLHKTLDSFSSFTVYPKSGIQYTILKQGGHFLVLNKPDYPLNQELVERMVQNLVHLQAEATLGSIQKDQIDLSSLGLQEKAIQVDFQLLDGTRHSLQIGDPIAAEPPMNYARFDNGDSIYGLVTSYRELFEMDLNLLHSVPAINFTPELLDKITLFGQENFSLEKQDDQWLLKLPSEYPSNPLAIGELLKKLKDLRLSNYIGDSKSLNLQDYGLESPKSSVLFSLAPSIISQYDENNKLLKETPVDAQTLRLSFGNAIDRIGYYCLYAGSVYQITADAASNLVNSKAQNFFALSPFERPIQKLKSLSIQPVNQKKRSYALSLYERVLPNNHLETDSNGNILYDMDVTKDGFPFDRDSFVKAYLKLMNISQAGLLPKNYQVHGDPLIVIETDDGQYHQRTCFYDFDALHLAMEINGIAVSYVQKSLTEDLGL